MSVASLRGDLSNGPEVPVPKIFHAAPHTDLFELVAITDQFLAIVMDLYQDLSHMEQCSMHSPQARQIRESLVSISQSLFVRLLAGFQRITRETQEQTYLDMMIDLVQTALLPHNVFRKMSRSDSGCVTFEWAEAIVPPYWWDNKMVDSPSVLTLSREHFQAWFDKWFTVDQKGVFEGPMIGLIAELVCGSQEYNEAAIKREKLVTEAIHGWLENILLPDSGDPDMFILNGCCFSRLDKGKGIAALTIRRDTFISHANDLLRVFGVGLDDRCEVKLPMRADCFDPNWLDTIPYDRFLEACLASSLHTERQQAPLAASNIFNELVVELIAQEVQRMAKVQAGPILDTTGFFREPKRVTFACDGAHSPDCATA